jgi:hypothetical protein
MPWFIARVYSAENARYWAIDGPGFENEEEAWAAARERYGQESPQCGDNPFSRASLKIVQAKDGRAAFSALQEEVL